MKKTFTVEVDSTGKWLQLTNANGEMLYIHAKIVLGATHYDTNGCKIHNSAFDSIESFLNFEPTILTKKSIKTKEVSRRTYLSSFKKKLEKNV